MLIDDWNIIKNNNIFLFLLSKTSYCTRAKSIAQFGASARAGPAALGYCASNERAAANAYAPLMTSGGHVRQEARPSWQRTWLEAQGPGSQDGSRKWRVWAQQLTRSSLFYNIF